MPTATANLFTRDDTLFGVCEGLGEEFGFHANYLRLLLASLLLWNAAAIVGLYLALGVVLAVSRWWWPARRALAVGEPVAPAMPVAGNDPAPVLAQAA